MNEFAVLTIAYTHLLSNVVIRITTNNPCHLFCYYTDIKPDIHKNSRTLRGLKVPWGAYFCFVAWNTIEQIEPGDTLIHTFSIPDWSYCQTLYFCFKGTVASIDSPSISPIFQHHHPGLTSTSFSTLIMHQNDDTLLALSNIWNCPTACPGALMAGRHQTAAQMLGSILRFQNVQIPWLATIEEAHLFLTASSTKSKTICNLRISAEQDSNPPDFSLDTWASGWNRYLNHTAKVDWDNLPTWFQDTEYTSPDISVPIQAIVNRADWQSGNPLVLFWEDYDHRSSWISLNRRQAYPYNVDSTKAARLYVKYLS